MCVITTTAGAAIATAITAIISSAVGVQSAVSNRKVSKFQAEQNLRQAKIEEQKALYERQEGIEDAREKRLNAIKNMGKQKVQLASGNIMTSSQMALNIFEDENISGEIDALKLLDNSEKRAQTYLESSQKNQLNANLHNYNANQAVINQGLSTTASLSSKFVNMAIVK